MFIRLSWWWWWWGLSYGLMRDFAGSKKAFMLSWEYPSHEQIAFCKDCSHKAGEHGVFEDSDANKPHRCMI
ncbi:MAG: hypothetical protein H0X50_06960 [Nitrosopumilus sp.]|nr:hypothetical protein [Nitrosopumilus sp.]